jgi:hypothetical protein
MQAVPEPSDGRKINRCPVRVGESAPKKAITPLKTVDASPSKIYAGSSRDKDVPSADEPAIEISLASLAIDKPDVDAPTAERDSSVVDLMQNVEDKKELVYTPSEAEESVEEESSDEEEECMPNEGWDLIDETDEEDALRSHGQSFRTP